MSRTHSGQRGTTIVELMTVMVVLGLLMGLLVAIIGPMLRAQYRSQAKLDTVQSAAAALYRIQRDLRQTYYKSTFACTTGGSATCNKPTILAPGTTAIAFPTAYTNGTGQFQTLPTGYPGWSGIMVYWIDAAGDLNWAFDTPNTFAANSKSQSAATSAQAVIAATTGVVPNTEIAQNVQQLLVAIPASPINTISLQMQAQSSENGSINETTYRSDVLARQ